MVLGSSKRRAVAIALPGSYSNSYLECRGTLMDRHRMFAVRFYDQLGKTDWPLTATTTQQAFRFALALRHVPRSNRRPS